MSLGNTYGVERPPRPSLPAVFWAFLAVLVSVRASLYFIVDPHELLVPVLISGAVSAVVLLLATVFRAPERFGFCAILALSFTLGFFLAGSEISRVKMLTERLSSGSVSLWEFRLTGDMSKGSYGYSGYAEALFEGRALGRVRLQADESYDLGTVVSGIGRFSPTDDTDYGISLRMQGIAGTVTMVDVEGVKNTQGIFGAIYAMRRSILVSFNPSADEKRSLLAGIVCGYRVYIKDFGLDELCSATGVSHMLAVSGTHLVMAVSLLELVISRLRLKPQIRFGALAAASFAFVIFCGAPASAIRAWAMALASFASHISGRRSHRLSAVCIAACLMIAIRPGCAGELGFLLSVISVLAISVFFGYMRYGLTVLLGTRRPGRFFKGRVGLWLKHIEKACIDIASVSLVCQLATLPIVAASFGEISLIAPLSNLLLSGLFSLLLAFGLMSAVCTVLPVIQACTLFVSDMLSRVFLSVLKLLSTIPGAQVGVRMEPAFAYVLVAFGSLALLVVWPKLSRKLFSVFFALLLLGAGGYYGYWRYFAPASLSILDVGQGDAILIREGRYCVLVDTGPDDSILYALQEQHVYHLDAVILTHLHEDHIGGLSEVLLAYDPGSVLVAEGVREGVMESFPELNTVFELEVGDRIAVGNFTLTVLWPTSAVSGEENEDSLVISLVYNAGGRSCTALLTGDAESGVLQELETAGKLEDIDVLKVGHHGSAASITKAEAQVLLAELAVASAGADNSYGHPTRECIQILEDSGALFLCTKDIGTVTVKPDVDGVKVCCAGPL